MRFEDHFSQRAGDYARYRPQYPRDLFVYLASLCPRHQLAWDCGTGNGQAAIGLAEYFDRVIATDASPEQISIAFPHERVEYRVERAEDVNLNPGSVDLVTSALAVHWFDLDCFYPKVRRVLRPQGSIAVWSYHLPVIEPGVDRALERYYAQVLKGYWPERFHYVHDRYQTLPFPFHSIQLPHFWMDAKWDLSQLLGFLDSWSATRKYEQAQGHHPVDVIWSELALAWGEPQRRRTIKWSLYVRVGQTD